MKANGIIFYDFIACLFQVGEYESKKPSFSINANTAFYWLR